MIHLLIIKNGLIKSIKMKKLLFTALLLPVSQLFGSSQQIETTHRLKVNVEKLRNSKGVVQFFLYNDAEAIPDETFTKYYRRLTAEIESGSAEAVFERLPAGKYAVNVLHDEDKDGKIRKGLLLPKEGVGFSNYESIGISNKPNFKKAAFELNANKEIRVKVIYF